MLSFVFLLAAVFGASAPSKGSEFNNGKRWSEMSISEKQASMDRLKMLNALSTTEALREGKYKNINSYNRYFNPTFDQRFNDAYNNWMRNNPPQPKYIYNAWWTRR